MQIGLEIGVQRCRCFKYGLRTAKKKSVASHICQIATPMSEPQPNGNNAYIKAREQALLSATMAVSRPQHSITISNPPWSALDDLMGEEEEVFEEALIPPENFNMVSDHVYRSSFPKKKHFSFLKKLGLKSVLLVQPCFLDSIRLFVSFTNTMYDQI